MRPPSYHCLSLVLALALASPATHAVDDPALAARLIQAGAPSLVLKQAQSALTQPGPAALPSATAWADAAWAAAGRLGTKPVFLAGPPSDQAPASAWSAYRLVSAETLLDRGETTQAREHLARLLWQGGASEAAQRAARHLVARAWLIEAAQGQHIEALNPVWLRLLQDHPELQPEVETAAQRMFEAGQAQAALSLLDQAGAAGAVAVLVRFRAGQIDAEQAEAALLALAPAQPDALRLRALLAVAEARANTVQQVQLLERLVSHDAASATPLWHAYFKLAEQVANSRQLLVGADERWLEQARSLQTDEPLPARAMLAWLAARGRDAGLRGQALAMLAEAWQVAGVGAAVPPLVGAAPFDLPPLNEATRYRLGELAAAYGDAIQANGFWAGIAGLPGALTPREWALMRADVLVAAGRHEAAVELLARMADNPEPLSTKLAAQAVRIVQAMRDAAQADAAERLALLVLPALEPERQRGLWMTLAQIAEDRGQDETAAERFLLAAVWLGQDASDSIGLEARQRAAGHLRKAGLKDDALRQEAWIRQHVAGAQAKP